MMKKNNMKYVLMAVAAMLMIIATRMLLSYLFTYHVGEVFSRVALDALFFYVLIRMGQRRRRAAD